MSTLLLVRHGQARAFDADSDRLSDMGETQARRLGEWIARVGLRPDEVVTGTLVRQRRTATLAGDAMRVAGSAWPEAREDAAWNEYDAGGILGRLAPTLAAQDPDFRALADAFPAAAPGERNRAFQRMFEVLMRRWETGEVSHPEVETFGAFHERVRGAFDRVLERDSGGRTVVVVSSGGPIGVVTQHTLGAPGEKALELNWRVRNASITEIVFSKGRLSLQCFNALPHLADPVEWTFR